MNDLRNAAGLAIDPYDYRRGLSSLMKQLGLRSDDDGARIGRYRLLQLVGSGAFGRVYRGMDLKLDRAVALKLIPAPELDAERAHTLVREEARALAALAHPGIVSVFDILTSDRPDGLGVSDGTDIVIVMEFVDGQTLRDWVETERPPWRLIVDAYVEAAEALAAAHERGIIHRDFKPSNVMRRQDGRIVILDFGVASVAAGPETLEHGPLDDKSVDVRGAVGTPAYMAPEQFDVGGGRACSDVYALGVSLHQALYGELPVQGDSGHELLLAKLAGPRPPPADSPVPAWIGRAVARAMAPTPTNRWPTMRAFAAALRPRPKRSRYVAPLALGLAAIATVAATRGRDETSCVASAAALPLAWERMRPTTAAVHETLGLSPEASTEISAAVDRYAADWRIRRLAACADGDDSSFARRRRHCLQRASSTVVAQLEWQATSDPPAKLVPESFPELNECDDAELVRRAPVPPDPATRRKLAEVETWIAHNRQGEVARSEFEAQLAIAQRLGHGPTIARVFATAARWERDQRHYDTMRPLLESGYEAALQGNADRLALELSRDLVLSSRTPDDGRRWARTALALADRLPNTERDRVYVYTYLSFVLMNFGKLTEAASAIGSAAELARSWPDHDWWATVVFVRAIHYATDDGNMELARTYVDEVDRRLLHRGFDDVSLEFDARFQIALHRWRDGDLERAESGLRELQVGMHASGEAAWLVRLNLVGLISERGRFDEALELLDDVRPDEASTVLRNVQWHLARARLLTSNCRLDGARAALAEAYRRIEADFDPNSVTMRQYEQHSAELRNAACPAG